MLSPEHQCTYIFKMDKSVGRCIIDSKPEELKDSNIILLIQIDEDKQYLWGKWNPGKKRSKF